MAGPPRSGMAWAEEDGTETADHEGGVFLPTDRFKERQLDFARRLIKDRRWSDAATLLDEILSSDRDFFFQPDAKAGTWRSVKVEASRLVGDLPPEGAEAYALQFRARADKRLDEALRQGDGDALIAVARRWFHTPAGQKATLLAAIESLDADQPLAAAAWLDRLAAAKATMWEPTLSVMRAIAWHRAGEEQEAVAILDAARRGPAAAVRIGGNDVTISYPQEGGAAWLAAVAGRPPSSVRAADEWPMHRGAPTRNALVATSRPLLVPRYRVPLTRHPEEARWLEARRKLAADQDAPIVPASMPLAVGGTVVVHTPMGLLAVDFATGKRLWLQTGGAAAPVMDAPSEPDDAGDDVVATLRARALAPVFDDATSGLLASDGRFVFAVESHPDALVTRDPSTPQMQVFGGERSAGAWTGGNTLAAYDLSAKGGAAWKLPAAPGAEKPAGMPWFMGPPLPVGDQVFVLVEEGGEVRLDVLEAASGRLLWTQPLAELDEDAKVDNPDSRGRRIAGLSPSLAEGVLVCPTGAGAVVAVDLATRTLLWGYRYPVASSDDAVVMHNGIRVLPAGPLGRAVLNGVGAEVPARRDVGRWLDSTPVLARGHAVLTPMESDELHCLDLRTGAVVWKRPRKGGRTVAGAVGDSLVIVGMSTVEVVDLRTGRTAWSAVVAGPGHGVSGRAMLSNERLFVPVDTPEVVEIDVATGRIVGRSAGRGGAVPGNLIAYRGEVISQGVDSLDVFHQAAPLEARIETAMAAPRESKADAWALLWRGHLALDRGDVASGIRDLREARAAAPDRVPPDTLADAMVFAMERDPAVAAMIWRDMAPIGARPAITRRALRAAVDGLVAIREYGQAWEACRTLLAAPVDDDAETALVDDAADAEVAMTESRWMRGRLAHLLAVAPPDLRLAIDAHAEDVAAALAADDGDATARHEALVHFIERFGNHPAALAARRTLCDSLTHRIANPRGEGDMARPLVLERDFLLLDLLRVGRPEDRRYAADLLAQERRRFAASAANDLGATWPVGQVTVAKGNGGHGNAEGGFRSPRTMPVSVTAGSDAWVPGIQLSYDLQQQHGIIVTDGFGRRIGGLLPIDDAKPLRAFGMGLGHLPASEASVIGRVVVIRGGGVTTAFELAPPASDGKPEGKHRRLWTHGDDHAQSFQPQGLVRVVNRRFPRNGNVELGMRIHEPGAVFDETGAGISALADAGGVRATGVPMLLNRTLQLRDPRSGTILWERRRLEPDAVIFGDDDFLCVCPRADGRKTLVLSMADGRVVRSCNLPGRTQRLLTHGRHVVAIQPSTDGGQLHADSVALELFDPVHDERIALGRYSGRSRASAVGADGLAVLEPSGGLTVIDLAARRVDFTTKLPDMPATFEQVSVLPWQDRYLVIVGRPETEAELKRLRLLGNVLPLPQFTGPGQPMTGSIWAVDRTSGDMLWPVPVTILGHVMHPHQPAELPILFFARTIDSQRAGERPRLSLLCLDKRTGHAVHADDRLHVRQDMLMSCDVTGNPAAHSITITPVGGGLPDLVLRFTGEPIAPQAPFQAGDQPAVSGDFGAEVEYWFNRVLTFPWPF